MKVENTPSTWPKILWPWSLAALCCFGLLLFLIAITIVLSLIPIFLPKKDASLSNINRQSNLFYLEYSTTAADGLTGFASNLADVSQQLNKQLSLPSNTINVEQVEVQQATNSGRRRRSIANRVKRTTDYDVLLSCQVTYPSTCISTACRAAFFDSIRQRCSDIINILLQLEIDGELVDFILQFLGFTLTVPPGFSGLNNPTTSATSLSPTPTSTASFLIIAVQSGLFRASSTWNGGIVPTDGSFVIIPENIIVSIDASILNVAVAEIQLGGTLVIGYQSVGPFVFPNSFNIVIIPGGSLVDATIGSTNGFSLAFNTAIICYSGGEYIGKTTPALITAHDSNGNIVSIGSPVSLSGTVNGPWSLLVYKTGLIVFQSGIQFLVQESGDSNDEETWCGGLIPTPSMCTFNGGCDLVIPPSVTLSISNIVAQLSLPIKKWIINGTLALGSPGLQTGFYFSVPCEVLVNSGGVLVDLTTGNESGIYFPENSQMIIYPNGTLEGQSSSFIYTYELGDITHIIEAISFSSTVLYNTSELFIFSFGLNSSSFNYSDVFTYGTDTTSISTMTAIIVTSVSTGVTTTAASVSASVTGTGSFATTTTSTVTTITTTSTVTTTTTTSTVTTTTTTSTVTTTTTTTTSTVTTTPTTTTTAESYPTTTTTAESYPTSSSLG